MTTGPNDVRCVVWALGEFFFIFYFLFYFILFSFSSCFFFLYLMIYIGTTDSLKVRCGTTQATTTTTGPNDARRVVWALGEFCYIFLLFLLYLLLYSGTTNTTIYRGIL